MLNCFLLISVMLFNLSNCHVAEVHYLQKRQIYYLCVNCSACYVAGDSKCENGGVKVGVGCSIANQCVAYHKGPVSCLKGCCCTVPTSPQVQQNQDPPSSYGVCQNGQLSKVRCSTPEQCSNTQVCLNGLCCTNTQDQYKSACGGEYAVSECSTSRACTQGFVCTASNYCCQCPVGKALGRIQGLCPAGYRCMDNGWCCGSCPGNVTPFGACLNGKCQGGRQCAAGNLCC